MDNKKLLEIIQSGQELTISQDVFTGGLKVSLSDPFSKTSEWVGISPIEMEQANFDILDYYLPKIHDLQKAKNKIDHG